ncbi:MAG TPA: hypothetical protein VN428_15445 [Bryobacteraceae bacterium]|nr:hypothetical protein [Bryobacteraceae bacterium]
MIHDEAFPLVFESGYVERIYGTEISAHQKARLFVSVIDGGPMNELLIWVLFLGPLCAWYWTGTGATGPHPKR